MYVHAVLAKGARVKETDLKEGTEERYLRNLVKRLHVVFVPVWTRELWRRKEGTTEINIV